MDTDLTQRPAGDYRESLTVAQPQHNSAVSWCAVFAGALASASLSLILLLLGTGFGLTLVSPWSSEGISATSFGVSSILGITLISVLASAMGGYLAGRLRTRWLNTHMDEVYFRDTAHGFLSWSLATLGTAVLLTSVIGSIVSDGVKAGTAVVGGATTLATSGMATAMVKQNSGGNSESGAENNMSPLPYLLDSLLRKNTNASGTTTPANTQAPDNTETVDAEGSSTAADSEQNTVDSPAAYSTAFAANNTDSAAQSDVSSRDASRQEIALIFSNAVMTGSFSDEDREYAGQLVAQVTGMDQQTAEQRVTETFESLQNRLEEAETTAREAADKAREVSAYTSLWLFISLLMGAFIASLMAVYGGRQRDL